MTRLRDTQAWPAVPLSVARYDKGMAVGCTARSVTGSLQGRPVVVPACGHEWREITPRGGGPIRDIHTCLVPAKTIGWLNRSSYSYKYVLW